MLIIVLTLQNETLPSIGDVVPRVEVADSGVAAVVASGGNIGAVNVPILGK